ncbi:hypothetical protein FRC04_005624 [Tulasnella sp. 424]|nr:hypothetical protein FRC04_005624 [Tulasnella sp. 424]KAG8961853.1 hypothetical protein FRC05_005685 [Tulasnella sp. 425]
MDDPSASRQSSVMPESSASSSPPTASKFHPYTTPTHRVTKGRYITSTDPRGYVPTFPDTCLAPDQPGYGQVIPSSGRKGKRSKYTTTPAATTASTPIAGSENNTSSDSTAYRSHPYSPSSVTSTESPYDSASPAAGAAGYEGGQQQQPYYQGYYQAMPTSAPGPGTASQSGYGGRQYQEYSYGEEADLSRNPSSSSSSRHRYAPYPPSSRSPGPPAQPLATPRQDQYTAAQLPSTSSTPPPQRSRHRSPVRDTRYDLPPISTIDLPRPAQQQPPSLPQGFSLPPITSLQGGDKPDMDASAVLRRLRLDEPADVPSRSREESYKPLYSGGGGQQQQTPAYPPGPPTYYGDASYQYGGGGDPRGREGGADPRWTGQPPTAAPGPQYHPSVTARGGSGRQW